MIIDPWGSELMTDYQKIVDEFGLERFNSKLFLEPNHLMRRGVVFAGRDLKRIALCIKEHKPFYALTGIMPTSDRIHFGTKSVVENLKYFQQQGAKTYILIADLEAAATRGVSLEDAKARALNFHIPAYIALGLNPKKTIFYFQSENKDVMHLGYKFAKKITLNEFRAIYGNADPGRIMSATTQVADILYPQLEQRMPGIIPVGIDQDPHLRLARDVVKRTKEMKFVAPSAIYHKYTPSLDGSLKMSKSKPMSSLDIPEDVNIVSKKLMRAKTGGRATIEEQKRLGAETEKCIVFEMFKQHIMLDDTDLHKRWKDSKGGKIMCGECKVDAVRRMTKFLEDFNVKFEKARKNVSKLRFLSFS